MQMKRRNNFICFLLAITMLISGMCFNSAKADSLFSCKNSVNSTSTIHSFDNLWSHPEVRTEEISGVRILTSSIKSENRSGAHTRLDCHLNSVEILSQNFFCYSTAVADDFYSEIRSNTVIINYIHQKDGKKS